MHKLMLALAALSFLAVGCGGARQGADYSLTSTEQAKAHTTPVVPDPATNVPEPVATAPLVAEGVKLYLGTEQLAAEPLTGGESTNFRCHGYCSYTWDLTLTAPLDAQSYGYHLYVSRRFHMALTLTHEGSATVLVDAHRLSAGSPAEGTLGGQPMVGAPGDLLTLELTLPDGGNIVGHGAGDPVLGGGGSTSYITLSQDEPPPSPTPAPAVGARLPSSRETTAGPAVSVGPDNILHLAWADRSGGSPAILYVRSTDGGMSFSPPVVVALGADAEALGAPTVAGGPAGTAALAWEQKRGGTWEIAFSRSADGTSFTAPVLVGESGRMGDRVQPALAAAHDGALYLAWRDLTVGETGSIFFARGTPSGAFGDGVEVSPFPEIQQDPVIAVDSQGRVHLAWSDGRDGKVAVYYGRADDGITFQTVKRVSEAEGELIPGLAVGDDERVHIVWASSFVYVYHTYYALSEDGGKTFSSGVMLSDSGQSVSLDFPYAAVGTSSEGTTYVAFRTASPAHGTVIHYDRSKDGIFGTDVTVAGGKDANTLSRPAIAADSQGRVFLAWGDGEQGRFQVHVARAAGGGTFDLEGAARVQG